MRWVKTCEVKPVEAVDSGTVRLVPTPRIDLVTIEQCRVEAARVYRQMRSGKVDAGDGAKLVWVVTQIAKLIEIGALEERLRTLEMAEPRRLERR
jgi:hypothetical protein